MSRQAWGIVPKLREVDRLLQADKGILGVVVEVHPEVCFHQLAGRPMTFSKKKAPGREERLEALRPHFGEALGEALKAKSLRAAGAAADDVIDAFVALWTARRVAAGSVVVLPSDPPRDDFGLPMQIVA